MIQLSDVHELDDFLSNYAEHIERLKQAGQPEILTIDGKAELVVQDAESYRKLLAVIDRAEAIEGIRRGIESMERGEGQPLEEFDRYMRDKYKIPPRQS